MDTEYTYSQQGMMIVLSGPSGAGKGTLKNEYMKRHNNAVFSVSMTTRPPRPGEIEGTDYYFTNQAAFQSILANEGFLEWAQVHGEYYGTPKQFALNTLAENKDIVLDIDVQGALQVKKSYPQALMIFIIPPSVEILEQRLRKRGTETEEKIQRRLANAKKELSLMNQYDYVVINTTIEEAYQRLNAIITAEKCRYSRLILPKIKN